LFSPAISISVEALASCIAPSGHGWWSSQNILFLLRLT